MRAWLRAYATKQPCHGFRRAWAALRYDERREVDKKKVHRLWREEGLQVKIVSPRKRVPWPTTRDGSRDGQCQGGLSESRIAVKGHQLPQRDTARPKPLDLFGFHSIQPS